MRRDRAIVLDEYVPPDPSPPPGVAFEWRDRKVEVDAEKGVTRITEQHIRRIGKRRIWVIKRTKLGPGFVKSSSTEKYIDDARIPFQKILDKTRVEQDDSMPIAPWENCDGYEHKIVKYHEWAEALEQRLADRYNYDFEIINRLLRKMFPCGPQGGDGTRHAFKQLFGTGYHIHEEEDVLVIPQYDFQHVYDYAREQGASKGVAEELVHCERRRTIRRLQDWFLHGWKWYSVTCDMCGESESVSGIDDEEYAENYTRREIAEQMVRALTGRGWKVTKLPDDRKENLEYARARFKRNLAYQNWHDEIKES